VALGLRIGKPCWAFYGTERGTLQRSIRRGGRNAGAGRVNERLVDLAAGVVGLLVGVAVAPFADRLATTSPVDGPRLRGVPLSPRWLLVAAATTVLGAVSGLVYGFTLEAVIAALFCWILVVVTRTDLEHRLIPNRIVLPGAVTLLVLRTIDEPSVSWVIAALAAGLALFLLVLAYPKGMGMGDVKLAVFLGAGLGLGVVVALFLGFISGAVPALLLLVRHGRAARKQAIPLGPFLALGGVVALFTGDAILDWYWD
jgi:leader peptidase (prepilin peptidase) / N-methyltransferase